MRRLLLLLIALTVQVQAQTVRVDGKNLDYRLVEGRQMVERSVLAQAFPGFPAGEGLVDLEELASDPKARVIRRDGRIVSIRYYDPRWASFYEKPAHLVEKEKQSQEAAPDGDRALEALVLELANQARQEHGLQPTAFHSSLQSAALAHSQEMVETGVMSHTSPTPGRTTPYDRILLTGFQPRGCGENLARMVNRKDATLAREVVDGWMNSPGHRQNLLTPEFSLMGIGIARKGSLVMITQLLATP